MLFGSPPCSPQIPSFNFLFWLFPFSTAISTKSATPSSIDINGSIENITSKTYGIEKVKIAAIRGNVAIGVDWYTFIPNKNDDLRLTLGNFGIVTNGLKENVEAIHHNLKLNSIRFGLAIYKFSTDMHGGAMRGVPLIDFYKKHTDKEVYDLLEITTQEQKEIEKVIPTYYDWIRTNNWSYT